jgi:hypothetical protein
MAEEENAPYSMWVNHQSRKNLVVLTADAVYVASIWKAQLPQIDLGLEDGKPADQLLPKATKVRLKSIERFQFKHVQVVVHQLMNKEVTIHYHDGKKTRKVAMMFESQGARDEFVNKLNDRLGNWPIAEKHEAPLLILANYLYIMLVISLLGALFSGIALFNPPDDNGSLPSRYWYATGPWGIAVPAMLISIGVLISGIWQLRRPPIIIVYEPPS